MILYKVDLLKLYEGRDSKTFFVKLFSFVILFFGIPVLLKCSSSYQYIRFPSSLFLYWTKFPQQDKKNYILFFLVYIYIWRSFLSKKCSFFFKYLQSFRLSDLIAVVSTLWKVLPELLNQQKGLFDGTWDSQVRPFVWENPIKCCFHDVGSEYHTLT